MTSHRNLAAEDGTSGRTVYMAELQCFLCGTFAGTFESDRKPLPPRGTWHPVDGGRTQQVGDWRQLRCNRCGGALYAESVEVMIRREEEDELRREVPRRGRPPKWLVEQRRREREEAEARLG